MPHHHIAYRYADYERNQDLPFVLGIEIRKPHHREDICDHPNGPYTKDFKFVGWHPHYHLFFI